jgi:hypothetical protein
VSDTSKPTETSTDVVIDGLLALARWGEKVAGDVSKSDVWRFALQDDGAAVARRLKSMTREDLETVLSTARTVHILANAEAKNR